jgi:hypothetical protein
MGQSPTDRYGERLAGVLSCYDRVMIGPQPTLSRSVGCWCLLAGPLNWGPRPPVARRSRSALATPESGHFSLAAPTLSVGQLCLSHHDIGADQLQSVVDPSASCSQSCWASFISTGFGSSRRRYGRRTRLLAQFRGVIGDEQVRKLFRAIYRPQVDADRPMPRRKSRA